MHAYNEALHACNEPLHTYNDPLLADNASMHACTARCTRYNEALHAYITSGNACNAFGHAGCLTLEAFGAKPEPCGGDARRRKGEHGGYTLGRNEA